MNDRLLGTLDRFVGALNEVLSCLSENLNNYIVWNEIFLDKFADKIKISLARTWKTYFDLFVAHLD